MFQQNAIKTKIKAPEFPIGLSASTSGMNFGSGSSQAGRKSMRSSDNRRESVVYKPNSSIPFLRRQSTTMLITQRFEDIGVKSESGDQSFASKDNNPSLN